ncbi:MAG: hypothetical protein ACLP59_26830 [Bryobacteraceae bacterium]
MNADKTSKAGVGLRCRAAPAGRYSKIGFFIGVHRRSSAAISVFVFLTAGKA